MDSQVKTHKLDKALVVTKAEEGRQVVRVVFLKINSRELAIAENVAVDATSNVWELGNPVRK